MQCSRWAQYRCRKYRDWLVFALLSGGLELQHRRRQRNAGSQRRGFQYRSWRCSAPAQYHWHTERGGWNCLPCSQRYWRIQQCCRRFALFNNTTGEFNNAHGREALNANVDDTENNAFGDFAMLDNTSGSMNTAVGDNALEDCTTGGSNVAIGKNACTNVVTGDGNMRRVLAMKFDSSASATPPSLIMTALSSASSVGRLMRAAPSLCWSMAIKR